MMQQVDEEVSFNYTHKSNTVIEINNVPVDEDTTLNYTLSDSEKSQREHEDQNQESTLSESEGDSTVSPIQTQSQSLFSGLSTPVTRVSRDITNDRFNGILYHIIPSDGQITILFSSKDLFHKFIGSIDKELRAQPINEVKSNYTTHIRGKWCTLTSDSNAASISATGPGHKLWREVIFSRLAIRLYQQYARETEDDINATVLSQTSTPTAPIHQVPSLPPLSPVQTHETATHAQQLPSVSTISNQVAQLHQISKSLQEQLSVMSSKIDILLSRQDQISEQSKIQELEEVSVTSISDDSNFVTLSETREDIRMTPGGATYSEILTGSKKDRTVSVETRDKSVNKNKKGRNQKGNSKDSTVKSSQSSKQSSTKNQKQQTTPKDIQNVKEHQDSYRTLIIGDSIVSGINRKGLTNKVECQSVPGATIDTVIDKLQIFDISKFDRLVVYVGGNDSSRKSDLDLEYFEEKYQQLITFVKNSNSSCKLFLCTSCPRGDTDVTDINEVIMRLCRSNKLTCIDTNADFYDKKNQLKHHFYKPRDSIHLSRSGTKRLLGTIDHHLCIVENFEKCVFPFSQSNTRPKQRRTGQYGQLQQTVDSRHREFTHSLSRVRPMSTENSGQQERPGFDQRHYEGYRHQRQSTEMIPVERCMKCGLTNHSTSACRHKTQVLCFKCHCYGHKDTSGLCWNI